MDKIIVFFAKNKMLVTIIVLATLIIGVYCYLTMKQESFPSTELDMVIVQVVYPGASPLDVEKNAVVPIEKELQKIAGIEDYSSVIIENAAILTIKIDQTLKDTRPTKDEIYRKMQNVPDLSPDVREINVIDANPNLMAVYTIGLHVKEGMQGSEKELYDYSRTLEEALQRLEGVAEVRIEGRSDPEVQIFVDPLKTQQYYISLNDIVQAINSRNVRSTGGNLKNSEGEKTIVTLGEFLNPSEVKDVIIRSTFDGQRVRVADVAKINQGFVEKDVLMRVNKTPGFSLSIVKKENADILQTIKTVNNYLEAHKNELPSNLEITPMQDNSRTIVSLLNVVTSNLITGFIIIFLVLLIFLDMKSALYTSLGMILIIFATLIYMTVTDISFNIISLAAIITVLGMIVDNSIVVSENIFNFKQAGHSSLEATRLGVNDVVMPIIVSTMTTVTAFAPMLFIHGIMGTFINQFPKVVIAALVISFFQAIFILPNQLQERKKQLAENGALKKKRFKNPLNFNRDVLFDKMKIPFGFFLKGALKARYFVIAGFVALLFASFNLAQDSLSNFVLVYDTSADTIIINLDSGTGNSIEKTSQATAVLEDLVLKTVDPQELIAVYTLVGEQVDKGVVSEQMGSLSGMMIYLVPSNDRTRTAEEIAAEINAEVDKTGLRQQMQMLAIGVKGAMSSTGKAVDIKIVGNNTESAKKIKDEIKQYLLAVPGIINYDDDDKVGKEELRVILNYEKTAELGINVATVAREIRTAYNGTVATQIQGLDNKLEFRVQFQKNASKNINALKKLLIPNNTGRLVALETFARIQNADGLSTLRHYNGQRTVTLTADLAPGSTTSQQVMKSVQDQFKDIPQQYPGMRIEFGGEAKETVKAISDLLFSFAIALIAIYIILLLQFNRLIQPLIILLIIPFGLIGVFFAFAAHKMPMSFMGFIGVIGLAGVVVNNGIIMIDLINKIIDEGVQDGKKGVFNAILEGAKSRLRPVFLTTATTILGLLPTVYGIGGKADTIVPIVMAMAYGLLFAALLTLIFLPCIFMISFDLRLFKLPQTATASAKTAAVAFESIPQPSALPQSTPKNADKENQPKNKGNAENKKSKPAKSATKKETSPQPAKKTSGKKEQPKKPKV